jgi:hypothetical protein
LALGVEPVDIAGLVEVQHSEKFVYAHFAFGGTLQCDCKLLADVVLDILLQVSTTEDQGGEESIPSSFPKPALVELFPDV